MTESENFYAQVERAAPSDLSRVVLLTDTGRRVTWQELLEETARVAWLLTTLGLVHGDRVAAQVEKSPEALFLYLACLRAGLVFLPLNPAYQRNELAYFVADAKPRLVVCHPEREALMHELASAAITLTLDDQGSGSLTDRARAQPSVFPTASVDAHDLACLVYTSGTTGRSKGAMLTHRNILSNALALVRCWEFSRDDVLLHALPIFHIHGLFVANHCVLLAGASMLWHRKFDVQSALRDLPAATVLMGVPTFYTRLLADPAWTRERCAGVRLFVSGSAPLLPETFEAFRVRSGERILERYGMSEAGIITSNPVRGLRKSGSVGKPLSGVAVQIVADDGSALAVGATGQIQIKADSVFSGYWGMPEKTREEFTADGWFRTGDLGYFDPDGYVFLVGRAKDLIISGGYNVYPKEIELTLDALPEVQESAVVGLPHPDFGEAVVAAVVCRPGISPPPEPDFIAALKVQLAGYKIPKRVFVIDELPRNAMGKVQKNLLRDRYASTFRAVARRSDE